MGDLIPCEHQVAGWHNGSLSCVLKNKKGQILKPVKLNANPTYNGTSLGHAAEEKKGKDVNSEELIPVCRDEFAFYELIMSSNKKDDISLRKLMPKFYGCEQVKKDDGQVIPHLVLQDLAYDHYHPCVMDIKIGFSQEYPRKPKIGNKPKLSYATQASLGFCLTGVRIIHPENGQHILDLRPDACKRLTDSEVLSALDMFYQWNSSTSRQIREEIAEGLLKIREWIVVQRSYKIRRGSVLILYDASQVLEDSPASSTSAVVDFKVNGHQQLKNLKVTVKMIDFAHVFHAFGDQDDNYLAGLDNLIKFYRENK